MNQHVECVKCRRIANNALNLRHETKFELCQVTFSYQMMTINGKNVLIIGDCSSYIIFRSNESRSTHKTTVRVRDGFLSGIEFNIIGEWRHSFKQILNLNGLNNI